MCVCALSFAGNERNKLEVCVYFRIVQIHAITAHTIGKAII